MAQLTRERREKEREKPFSLISVFPCVIRVLMKQVMSWMGAGRRCSVALARLEDQPPPPRLLSSVPPSLFGVLGAFWVTLSHRQHFAAIPTCPVSARPPRGCRDASSGCPV